MNPAQDPRWLRAEAALFDAWVAVLEAAITAQRPAAEQLVRALLAAPNAERPAAEQLTAPQLVDLLLGMGTLSVALARQRAAWYLADARCGLEAALATTPGGFAQ